MLAGAPGVTVTMLVPLIVPEVAVMLAGPSNLAVSTPLPSTSTASGLELFQVTPDAGDPPIVALACMVVPDTIELDGRAIARVDADGPGPAGELEPPQAARRTQRPAWTADVDR